MAAAPAPDLRPNLVPWRPPGLVVALQYWAGDAPQALRLARLMADIEPEHRADLTLVLVRRFDLDEISPDALETVMHCNAKFVTYAIRSESVGTGHPDGSNALWDGTMAALAARWRSGDLNSAWVFTIEADGCPVAPDWARRLMAEHVRTIAAGKDVTGPLMRLPFAHVNGTLIASLGWWLDHPSLRTTPTGYAWDLHHRETFIAACRPTQEIKNLYGTRKWSDAQLGPMSNETAWIANAKDDSVLAWAEAHITAEARAKPVNTDLGSPGWRCGQCGYVNENVLCFCLGCHIARG